MGRTEKISQKKLSDISKIRCYVCSVIARIDNTQVSLSLNLKSLNGTNAHSRAHRLRCQVRVKMHLFGQYLRHTPLKILQQSAS